MATLHNALGASGGGFSARSSLASSTMSASAAATAVQPGEVIVDGTQLRVVGDPGCVEARCVAACLLDGREDTFWQSKQGQSQNVQLEIEARREYTLRGLQWRCYGTDWDPQQMGFEVLAGDVWEQVPAWNSRMTSEWQTHGFPCATSPSRRWRLTILSNHRNAEFTAIRHVRFVAEHPALQALERAGAKEDVGIGELKGAIAVARAGGVSEATLRPYEDRLAALQEVEAGLRDRIKDLEERLQEALAGRKEAEEALKQRSSLELDLRGAQQSLSAAAGGEEAAELKAVLKWVESQFQGRVRLEQQLAAERARREELEVKVREQEERRMSLEADSDRLRREALAARALAGGRADARSGSKSEKN